MTKPFVVAVVVVLAAFVAWLAIRAL